jgi:hypothetical protein
VLLGLGVGGGARADDYVSVRGAYYREASTRVVQPMVEVERDSPGDGVDVTAHFLVDAITSASASAGVSVDSLFTEVRNDAGLSLRKRWGRSEATLGYRYSAESDYWSHSFAASFARRFWGDTGRIALSVGLNLDTLTARGRTIDCSAGNAATAVGPVPPNFNCSLNGYYTGLTWTQVWSPVWIMQLSGESLLLNGFQGNPYRSVANLGYEKLPSERLRTALSGRVARYFPRTHTGVQLQARIYEDFWPGTPPEGRQDPWNVKSLTLELRVSQPVTRDLEVRLSYRQYNQTKANFWCDSIAHSDCYSGPGAVWYSSDPKLGPMHTEYPEVKLFWDATALADVPFLRWFAAGNFEVSYGRLFQSTSYGAAHVLQAGYRMTF